MVAPDSTTETSPPFLPLLLILFIIIGIKILKPTW
jgi:hypothetical protein